MKHSTRNESPPAFRSRQQRDHPSVEEVRSPIPLVIRGKPYPPTFAALDRGFVLSTTALTSPFQQLAHATNNELPFGQLPMTQRANPHQRAHAYYSSIEHLSAMQAELLEFAKAICYCSIVRSSPTRRAMASFERQYAECQLAQLHPVSCPTLDVEQNAKQPAEKIERMIVDALWNATRSVAFDVMHVLHHLVGQEITGRLDTFDNAGCRFFYYENDVIRGHRWPTLQVRELVGTHSTAITGSANVGRRQQRLLRTIPSWLKKYVAIISGTKIKASSVVEEEVSDRHLPACTTYALAVGTYVLTGWSEAELSWQTRVLGW